MMAKRFRSADIISNTDSAHGPALDAAEKFSAGVKVKLLNPATCAPSDIKRPTSLHKQITHTAHATNIYTVWIL